MKRAFQNLFRKGEGNPIKIVCLGVGLAIGLVMLAEVIFERSYDNLFPGWRIRIRYRVLMRVRPISASTSKEIIQVYRGPLLPVSRRIARR